MNTKMNQSINVGVDTGKFQLDIYIRPLDIYFTVTNDEKGIKEAVNTIKKYKPERIVIEATGRLEMPFIIAAYSHEDDHSFSPKLITCSHPC
jgi:transposase